MGKIGRMKGSDSSGVLSIMIGHKVYILSPLCVQEESDELIDSKTKFKSKTSTNLNYQVLLFLKERRLILIWC